MTLQVIQAGAFATLHGLQNLSLSHNSLHSLPSTLPRHLRHLSVHHNLLQEIPHLSLHNLTFLSLCHNPIKSIETQQVRRAVLYSYHQVYFKVKIKSTNLCSYTSSPIHKSEL